MSLHAPHSPDPIVFNDREQIQYLLGNPPSWMMRYGIGMMSACFVLMMCLSYFIQYPDVLETKIMLTTANPPIRVIAQSSGRISDLLVQENQVVGKGQVLAVLENPADWRNVLQLEAWLMDFKLSKVVLLGNLQLGNLQEDYSTFCQHWKDYHYFSTNHNTSTRIDALQKQISNLQQIGENLLRQQHIFQQEFELNTQETQRQKQLHLNKLISDKELEQTEIAWLQQKRQVETTASAVLHNQMQIQQLENQINELGLVKSDSQNEKELSLAEDVQRLTSAIAQWKQTCLIVAPIQGTVSFSRIWSAQQSVAGGEEMLAIIPENNNIESGTLLGKASVSSQNMGKLKPGNRSIIRLDAFPAQQFGSIDGLVSSISAMPKEGNYLIDVALPNNMNTSYGKSIPFRQEMSGQVRIITENRRIIERVFDQLKFLLENK